MRRFDKMSRAELIQELMEKERRCSPVHELAAIVESSDDAIIGKTLSGIISSWNKGAERIFGYSAEEIIGRNISILSPTDLYGEITKMLEKIRHG